MGDADRLAAEATTGAALMERAGEAVAQAALRLVGASGPRRIAILCGPGNNGGDGYVAARYLALAGCEVTVGSLVGRDALTGDAARAAALWPGEVLDLDAIAIETVDLIVDALFGAGLSRDVAGAAKATIERVNCAARTSGIPVLAVDMPSGVDGDSGAIRGIGIVASDTITFFRLKPGHVLMPGRRSCGTVALADIGISPTVLDTIAPKTMLNVPRLWAKSFPVPGVAGHKYTRGHAVVLSGPIAQTGAARLCARGALRAGAGLVTVATPGDALVVHAVALTAVMTRVCDGPAALSDLLQDRRKNAIVLGPGLGVGASTRAMVQAALAADPRPGLPPRSIVLDADALTSFADQPDELFAAIAAGGHAVVLTPHDGEFAKLFGHAIDAEAAKPSRARLAARMAGGVVVLKGPDTVVADPGSRVSIAASEAPWLATAGSGDVLAGMITGLLAQGMHAFDAASSAVWMHAEAARLFGAGLISEDIPEMLPRVLTALCESDLIAGA
jgi:hydroxyethylthiazole kinase-like uncharacterized protein yjeF